jgi:hypothetical protein
LSRNQEYKELGAEYSLTKQILKRKSYLQKELKKLESQIILQPPPPSLPPKIVKKKKGRLLLTPVTQVVSPYML